MNWSNLSKPEWVAAIAGVAQAVGALLALFVTTLIYYLDTRRRRDEEQKRRWDVHAVVRMIDKPIPDVPAISDWGYYIFVYNDAGAPISDWAIKFQVGNDSRRLGATERGPLPVGFIYDIIAPLSASRVPKVKAWIFRDRRGVIVERVPHEDGKPLKQWPLWAADDEISRDDLLEA